MDQRRPAPHPFSRPQTSQPFHETRFAPIPPPPYTSQSTTHSNATHHNGDPFLRRRNEQQNPRTSPVPAEPPRPYAFVNNPQLTANLFPGASDFANIAQQRRNSYGSATPFGAGGIDRYGPRTASDPDPTNTPQQTLPPPPLAHSNYASLFQLRNHPGESTRQMVNRPASPKMLEDQPLPPPPPFNGRHMPPPSSPQTSHAQQSLQVPPSQRPPPPPPFSGNRELPALSAAPRPGSSMSISSMLGTDPGRPAREPEPYSNPPSSTITSSTISPSVGAQSPTRLRHNGIMNPRSHSPERYNLSQGTTTRPFRAYSGGSPRHPTSSADVSLAEVSRFGATQPPQYSPSSDTGSRQEWRNAQNRRQSTERLTQRPNSQPSGYSNSHLDYPEKMQQQLATSEIDELRRLQSVKRHLGNIEGKNREAAIAQARRDYGEAQAIPEPQVTPLVDRKLTDASTHTSPTQGRQNGSNYPYLVKSSAKSETTSGRFGHQGDSILNRVLERNPPAPTNLSQSPFSPESLRRLREERLVAVASQQHGATQPPAIQQAGFVEHVDGHQGNTFPRNASVPANLGAPSIVDHQNRIGEEMNQLQKNSLSLFMENQKRGGRVSPLPQAVQGAQGKLSTPASDPGIKSEFARMFIGIGSGVGSAGPMRSETSTPIPRSPIRNQEPERRTPLGLRGDQADLNKPRAGSRGGRRVRKPKEDELKMDVENGDSRASAGIPSSKSAKKSKLHHHHILGHHHHHYDEQGNLIPHHHHHHLDHHHHHHSPNHQHKPPATPPPPPTHVPKTTINNDALLESVRHLPRHHLGSTLYCPSISPPNSTGFPHTKLGYTCTPKPIPRFDGQENCTFTVRIPRFYLTPAEREEVCRRRALWGSDVYTDDSDPLAAAIHAGWIRGDWGDGIDLSMLGLDNAPTSKPVSSPKSKQAIETISSLPAEPTAPRTGKDLHLTLLILPTLQFYASTTVHGIKSRAWGNNHDGVSFRVEKIAWVDGGVSNAEERGGEARRKRMKFSGTRTALGPGIKLTLGRKKIGAESTGVGVAVGA